MKDNLNVSGKLKIYKNGKLVRDVSNLVVNAGLAWIIQRMNNATANVMSHMVIGTGVTVTTPAVIAIESEVARVPLTTAGGVASSNAITFEATFPAGSPATVATITEAGILNADIDGTLLSRTLFSPVTKEATDIITISWVITLEAGV